MRWGVGLCFAAFLVACRSAQVPAPAWQPEERQEFPNLGFRFILLDFRVLLVPSAHEGWLQEEILRPRDYGRLWRRIVQGRDPRFVPLTSVRLFFIDAQEDSRRCWSETTSERITVTASGSIVEPAAVRMKALVRYAHNWDVWKQEVETTLGDRDLHLLEGPQTPDGRLVFLFRPEIVDTRK